MHANLAGKKHGKHSLVKSNTASVMAKVLGEPEYYLNLENEDEN